MTNSLALLIKKKLKESHLTAGKVEKIAGLKTSAVRNIVSGSSKNPSALTLKAIAKVFNCSIEDLLAAESPEGNTRPFEQEKKSQLMLEDLDLFLKVTEVVIKFTREKGYKLTMDQALNLIRGIYSYSSMEKKENISMEFVQWIFENMANA